MKKVIAAGVVVTGLLGAGVGAAAWSGRVVTDRLEQQTRDLTATFPGFKVVKEELDSGLFTSTRTVTLQLGCVPSAVPGGSGGPNAALAQPIRVTWRDTIHHGPLPSAGVVGWATVDSELVLPPAWQAAVQKVLADQPPLRLHSAFSFGGKFVSELTVPSLKWADPSLGTAAFHGLKAQFSGSTAPGAERAGIYTLEMPGAEVEAHALAGSTSLKLGRISLKGEVSAQPDATLWLSPSKATGAMESLEISATAADPGAKPFHAVFTDMTLAGESSLDKGLWSTTSTVSLQGRINDFAIDKIELQTSLKRLHAAAYQRLMLSALTAVTSCDQPTDLQALQGLLENTQKELASLLPHDPEYAVDRLAIELSGKRAELSYGAGTRGVTVADLTMPLPLLMFTKGVFHAGAKVHVGLIEEVAKQIAENLPADANPFAAGMAKASGAAGAAGAAGPAGAQQMMAFANVMIDEFAASGYLTREGDFIVSSAAVEGGQLSVNGKPMALPGLGGLPTP